MGVRQGAPGARGGRYDGPRLEPQTVLWQTGRSQLVTHALGGACIGAAASGAALAEQATRAVSKLRTKEDIDGALNKLLGGQAEQRKAELEREQELADADARLRAHDAKVRAFVEGIKKKNAAKEAEQPQHQGGADGGDALAAPAPSPPRGFSGATTAVEAANWLAKQGIVAPAARRDAPASKDEPAGSPPAASATTPAAAPTPQAAATPESRPEATPEATAAPGVETSPSGIEAVLGYRVHLGNEQWQVRWKGDAGEEGASSWETWRVLDAEPLRRRAEELRKSYERGG